MKSKDTPAEAAGKKSVFGVASSRLQANRIVDHLANAGFAHDDISLLLPVRKDEESHASERGMHMFAGRSAAQIGIAVGGAIGWLAGWHALSVPGFGHFVAAGPLGAVMTGATSGSTATGRVRQALAGLGLRGGSAGFYRDQVKEGQILVSLQTNHWHEANAARKIFEVMGAANITIGGPKASGALAGRFFETSPERKMGTAGTRE